MGRIARLLSFVRVVRNGAKISDVKVDPGGGPNITGEHFAPPGDDSYPLPTDYAVTVVIPRGGGEVIVGYVDPLSDPVAQPGDKRVYGRNSAGAPIVQLWLKNDGTAILSNDNGSLTLQPSGQFLINGARITTGGDVITAAGVSLDNHPHDQGNDSDGDAEVATDPPTATE